MQNDQVRPWVNRYEANVFTPEFWDANASNSRESVFPRDPGNQGVTQGWADAAFDDSKWATMRIPGTWTSQGHRHSGVFWFRRSVQIPRDWAGKELILNLGGADKQDITYFNGQQVGATGKDLEEQHWNAGRHYRIPGHLVTAGRAVIASRVYSFCFDGGLIGPAQNMSLALADAPEKSIPLAGDWPFAIERDFGFITPPAPIPGPGIPNTPYMLFDNMIAPLVPYALRGGIWYQGESNTGAPQQYQRLMNDLVCDWRHAFGLGDFPFLITQLANFNDSKEWAYLREAQLKSLATPNTGMAVIIDIGHPTNIHPTNKRDVGKRLSLWALAQTYGKHVACSGPLYADMTIEGAAIRCHFRHVAGGLKASDGEALRHFLIAGEDRKFVPADVVIDGDSLLVSSPKVSKPIAVRYAWANNPEKINFYNAAGLPASPFRTDTW
jgi:sialate O-acetylesterase